MKINKFNLKANKIPSTAILFLFLAPFVIISYALYIFNPANADNIFLYALLILGDSIGMLAVMGLWITILMDIVVPEHHSQTTPASELLFLRRKPTVDILITVYGEPMGIIEETVRNAVLARYEHNTFILDDKGQEEVKKLADKYGAQYIKRNNNEHAKAGNINNGLLSSKAEFFIVLDADQCPKPEIIEELLPYMADEKIAMAQSPQVFKNTNEFISAGTSQAQEIFYKYVQPAKNVSNSVFCVGTNMMYRRSAIDEIGGIKKISHSEDIWTTFHLHEAGWKTIFINKTLAYGLAPNTINSYFNQQIRWAKGGLGMLFQNNPLFSKKLTFDQKIQYFLSNVFFLVGIPIFLYTVFPILYLLFDLKPLVASSSWLFHYLPYLFIYYFLSWLFLSKVTIANISVSIASYYPYLLALMQTIFERDHKWVSTTSLFGQIDVVINWTWSHVLIMVLTVAALFIGWYEPSNVWVTILYSCLAIWNFYLLYMFVTGERRVIKND